MSDQRHHDSTPEAEHMSRAKCRVCRRPKLSITGGGICPACVHGRWDDDARDLAQGGCEL